MTSIFLRSLILKLFPTIRYIKNPTISVQIEAINRDPCTLQYIQNPSKELQLIALKSTYNNE